MFGVLGCLKLVAVYCSLLAVGFALRVVRCLFCSGALSLLVVCAILFVVCCVRFVVYGLSLVDCCLPFVVVNHRL